MTLKRFCWILSSCLFVLQMGELGRADELVVVDRIEVRSDGNLDQEFLDSLLGLTPGEQIARPDLDRMISTAEARLKALGYFENVVFTLKKGLIRGHFILDVELAERSDLYFGGELKFGRGREGSGYGYSNSDSTEYNLFSGKRNLFGRGIKVDFNLAFETSKDESARRLAGGPLFRGESEAYDAILSAYVPRIAATPVNIGAAVWGRRSDSESKSQSEFSRFKSQSAGDLHALITTFGVSRGLFTSTLSAIRFRFDARTKSVSVLNDPASSTTFENDFSAWRTNIGLQLKYSEKTRLVLVESGLVALFTASRTYAPQTEPPAAGLSLEYTWFWRNAHALTPLFGVDHEWWETEDGGLSRYYNAGFRYEWVATQNLVIGVEHGIYDSYAKSNGGLEIGLPSKRVVLRIHYLTPTLTLGFSFVYGEPGADELSSRDFSDVTRLDL